MSSPASKLNFDQMDVLSLDDFALMDVVGGRATLAAYGVEVGTPAQIEAQREKVPVRHREGHVPFTDTDTRTDKGTGTARARARAQT